MSALGGTLRQEGLKVAEARVRVACMIGFLQACLEWSMIELLQCLYRLL